MTKAQKELLDKCKLESNLPLFDDIYILPTNEKHESGFKKMFIIGEVRDKEEYYLIDSCCDVVNLGFFNKSIKEVNIDTEHLGIIHFWSNYQLFKCGYRMSSCTFEFVDRKI